MERNKDMKVPITISRGAQISITVRDYHDSDWCITDIAGDDNGTIAITGETSKSKSYITSFSLIAGHGYFNFFDSSTENANRYCDILPGGRIATVTGHEIGIFNTTNTAERSYLKKNINDLYPGNRIEKSLSCIAWDAKSKHIVIGETKSRNVYVLDENLKSKSKISLPESIKWPVALNVHGESLLVCDKEGRGFFSVSMEDPESYRTFVTPGDGWWPDGVCTDRKGNIYVLWSAVVSEHTRCQVIKYNPQGNQLLSEDVARYTSLTTVKTNEGEKLILAPYSKGILLERPLPH